MTDEPSTLPPDDPPGNAIAPPKRGRPTLYTEEIVTEILERLADGESLRAICRDEHMPADRTVRTWVYDNVNGFSPQYQRARDMGTEALVDTILEIANDGRNDWMDRVYPNGTTERVLDHEHVQRSKLRIEAIQWIVSKIAPKKWANRTALDMPDADELSGGGEAVRRQLIRRVTAMIETTTTTTESPSSLPAPTEVLAHDPEDPAR